MDEWGVDVAVTGSQKGFMLPAGLAIVGFSPEGDRRRWRRRSCRALPRRPRHARRPTPRAAIPYTPAGQPALRPRELLDGCSRTEGLENVFARHHRIAEGIRRAVDAWGLKLCAVTPDLYSDTVSAIMVPDGFDGTKVVTHAAEKYGVAFGVGLGEVAGKVFRIGHLGS